MKQVVIVVFDGVEALDVTGPASVFAAANQVRPDSYAISLASAAGGEVVTGSGVTFAHTLGLQQVTAPIDTLLVAGGSPEGLFQAIALGVPSWIAQRAVKTRRVGSVCTGAFILGAAGLLDGRRATTHWRAAAELQGMFATCQVDADPIFTFDGVYTSAGVTAGIDLALHLVAEDAGDRVAIGLARELVVFLKRSGGQSQYSGALAAQAAASPLMAELVEWISDHLTTSLTVADLARRAKMTERTFTRAFARETGTTPARFVSQERLRHARSLLETTNWPLARVAQRSGFGSVDSLERAFRRDQLGSPMAYRQRLSSRGTKA